MYYQILAVFLFFIYICNQDNNIKAIIVFRDVYSKKEEEKKYDDNRNKTIVAP